jgi:hypothetical protein
MVLVEGTVTHSTKALSGALLGDEAAVGEISHYSMLIVIPTAGMCQLAVQVAVVICH